MSARSKLTEKHPPERTSPKGPDEPADEENWWVGTMLLPGDKLVCEVTETAEETAVHQPIAPRALRNVERASSQPIQRPAGPTVDRPSAQPREQFGVPSIARSGEDPEARQNRKMALMASLSDGLPTLPAYVFELNSLLSTAPVNLKRVAEIIRTDPSLTAQVLRLCNSAMLGVRERVTRIAHAVMLVGTERLRTMVLTCSLVEYVGHRVASQDVQSFWQHCFLTAALGDRLAHATHYPQPEQAYLAGLLHDIGALPLLVVTSAEAKKPDHATVYGWGESVELEKEHFGTDHCEVGGWIGVSWNFSPDLLEVMTRHHWPLEATQDRHLVGVVAAADQFCVRRGIMLGAAAPELSEGSGNEDQEILQACLPELPPQEAARLAETLETDFLHLVQLMEFGASGLFGGGIPKNPFRDHEG